MKPLEILAGVVFLTAVALYAFAAIAIERTGRAFAQMLNNED